METLSSRVLNNKELSRLISSYYLNDYPDIINDNKFIETLKKYKNNKIITEELYNQILYAYNRKIEYIGGKEMVEKIKNLLGVFSQTHVLGNPISKVNILIVRYIYYIYYRIYTGIVKHIKHAKLEGRKFIVSHVYPYFINKNNKYIFIFKKYKELEENMSEKILPKDLKKELFTSVNYIMNETQGDPSKWKWISLS